jgi:phage/plasmid-like protein (TIGR03299 family)
MADYFESGFVVREQAWHGLATVLENAPSVEEAIIAAGLDWKVETAPISASFTDENGVDYVEVDTHRALVRNTDRKVLGVVSNAYKVFQNHEAFGWFQPLVEDGTVTLETAGSLQEGRKVWVLARYSDDFEVKEGDKVIPYLLLAAGHDGNLSIRITNTPVRVVCWNTLAAAGVRDDGDGERFDVSGGYSIAHTGNVTGKVQAAREAIVTMNRELKVTASTFRKMAGVPATEEFVRAAVREVFDDQYLKARKLVAEFKAREARASEMEDVQIRQETREKIAELEAFLANPRGLPTEKKVVEAFHEAPGAKLAGETAWGAYNAITYHIDHGKRGSVDSRLASSWFGTGASHREKSLAVVAKMAGVTS